MQNFKNGEKVNTSLGDGVIVTIEGEQQVQFEDGSGCGVHDARRISDSPDGYSDGFIAGFRIARSMAVDAVSAVRNQDASKRLNLAIDRVASIQVNDVE